MDEDDAPRAGMLRRLMPCRAGDTVCIGLLVAGAGYIAANALFMQAGPHPAPFFAAAPQSPRADVPMPPAKRQARATLPAATLPAAPPPKPVATARTERHDPIAELLEPSNRTIAVQRALTEFGYGQIKPTGTVGPETKAAIEKFERERKLPVTGQVTERLQRELTAMKGGPL